MLQAKIKRLRELLQNLRQVESMQRELELLKNRTDVPSVWFDELEAERKSALYQTLYSKDRPLVTVCIATFNRSQLLCERSLRSIREQSYTNLEIIVVGDNCTDDTPQRLGKIRDNRIRFVNRASRGDYPTEPFRRWCVAGTSALNDALNLATGDFITHLDDDDWHMPDRLEKLLAFTQTNRLELAYHPFFYETIDGDWNVNPAERFAIKNVTTSSVFYTSFFKRIHWDIHAHLLGEPGDWNRLRKFAYLGARLDRFPEPLLKHFREKNQGGDEPSR